MIRRNNAGQKGCTTPPSLATSSGALSIHAGKESHPGHEAERTTSFHSVLQIAVEPGNHSSHKIDLIVVALQRMAFALVLRIDHRLA